MEQLIFSGFIIEDDYGDNSSTIFIGRPSEPFTMIMSEKVSGNMVSVRYWISDKEQSKEAMREGSLLSLSGAVEADYSNAYSEYTGYLWTDETLIIGGHDLLSELYDNVGKYIYLEIDIDN